MRAAPVRLPPSMSRQAAVQRTDMAPTSAVLKTTYRTADILDRRWFSRYQEWQDWARRYAKILGVVRFAAGITADTCARCDLIVEERDPNGDWDQTDNKQLDHIFDNYGNDRQTLEEMMRTHAWHYQIAGEMLQVLRDNPTGDGFWWTLHSIRAAEFDKPQRGFVRIKEAPNGTERDGTAFVVPKSQVVRFWLPDEEWPALATSPMAASIEDLHRVHSLNRYMRKTAESRVAMNGVFWTPGEAHQAAQMGREGPGAGGNQPSSELDRQYVDWAKRAFTDDEDVAGVAAFGLHWDSKFGHPVWVKIGDGLDPHLIEASNDAITSYARGINLPASLVVGGGPGKQNHWTEWLVDDKFFEFGIAWVMNRITHQDMTKSFLRPYLKLFNLDPNRFRVGYDKSPVVVKPDNSEFALKLYLAGILKGNKVLEDSNYDPEDMMGPDELAKVISLASRGRSEPIGVPLEPSTMVDNSVRGKATVTTKGPPPAGPPSPAGPPPAAQAAAGTPHPSVAKANRALRNLTQIKRDTGRQLLAAADTAFAEAMRHAGVKVKVRASKKNQQTRSAALAAVEAGAPLGPHLAAVGLSTQDALANAFVSFRGQANTMLITAQQRRRQALIDAGFNPDDFGIDDERSTVARDALAASLLALAYGRLTSSHPHAPAPGEVTGDVPASLITDALHILEGSADPTFGTTDDQAPSVVDVADWASPEDQMAIDLADEGVDTSTSYTWAWGFYGDPHRPLELHQDLGYSEFTTNLPGGDLTDDTDDALSNPDNFPETDYLSPGDHDGCTCEWVPNLEESAVPQATMGRLGENALADQTPEQLALDAGVMADTTAP